MNKIYQMKNLISSIKVMLEDIFHGIKFIHYRLLTFKKMIKQLL